MEHQAAAAVAAAWPGIDTLARFRRRIALELVTVKDGPSGPYTCLAARLSASLRAKCPRLVAEASELCSPPDGTLRFAQLLAHRPGFYTPLPSPKDERGGAFLYCRRSDYDICVVLDLAALIQWHAAGGGGGSPLGPRTPSDSGGGGTAATRRQGIDDGRPYDARRAGSDVPSDDMAAGDLPPPPPPLSFEELGLRAYPGPSEASLLRRSLVQRLGAVGPSGEDGLPPYTVPWRQLAPLIAGSQAAASYPPLASAATFRTFLEHPASLGAFTATRISRNNANNGTATANTAAVSYVDCVSLSVPTLRRIAITGVLAAIIDAWPGTAPPQRLKRAAARILSTTQVITAAGPHAMNSGPMCNELIKRESLAYATMRGANRGVTSRLDESHSGGFLEFVQLAGKEGCFRLRLNALLLAHPRTDRDLGLGQALGSRTAGAPHPPSAPLAGAATGGATGAAVLLDLEPPPRELEDIASGDGGAADPWVSPSQIVARRPGLPVPVPVPVMVNLQGPQEQALLPQPQSTANGAVPTWATAGVAGPAAAVPNPFHHAGGTASAGADDGSGFLRAFDEQPPSVAQQQQQQAEQLVEPVVHWVRTPTEFDTLVQHCCSAGQVGVAAHCGAAGGGGRRVEVAAIYAPAAAASATDAAVDSYGAAAATWPAVAYVFDCGALFDGLAESAAAASLRCLLENPCVVKVAHGCGQVASLAACCGAAAVAPLLDTRIVLQALTAMLPPLPALPAPAAAVGSYAAVGPLAAAALAALQRHVGALRDALGATGLWSDRPELVGALLGRHTAALREDAFGVREWASNASGHETALVAAARHLPELWEALTNEAVPWVAMAAASVAVDSALAAARR